MFTTQVSKFFREKLFQLKLILSLECLSKSLNFKHPTKLYFNTLLPLDLYLPDLSKSDYSVFIHIHNYYISKLDCKSRKFFFWIFVKPKETRVIHQSPRSSITPWMSYSIKTNYTKKLVFKEKNTQKNSNFGTVQLNIFILLQLKLFNI